MNKRTLSIILAYVGILTGAGLSSGQESLQYFLSFGKEGLLGIVVVGILHGLLGGIILQLGSHYYAESHIDVLEEITKKPVVVFMDFCLLLNCFLMGFVMIAGAGSNLGQQFNLPTWVGALICTVLIIVVGMMDFNKVTQVIGAFTPLVIIFTIIGAIHTISTANMDWQTLDQIGKTLDSPFSNVGISTLNYFGMCMISGISMAFVLGGSRTDSSEAGKGGMVGGFLVASLIFLVGFTLFLSLDKVKDADIPMQIVLDNVHPIMGVLMSIIIFGMIFNTAISLFYSAARRLSRTENAFRRNLVIFTLIGFGLSFLGFKTLMSTLYPILGFLGLALTLILIISWFRERKGIKEEWETRDKISDLARKKIDDDLDYGKHDKRELEKLAKESIIDDKIIQEAIHEEIQEEYDQEDE